ncbi:hypothetical protein BGW80DRAFT_1538715 [Lactifluus volemus]|nr:hypothetical protein BGW80DRAFT_1538715 [Lactifluus volemus]
MANLTPVDVGLSTTPSSQCATCSSRVAVYTCPRCETRTCSLPCSVEHKKCTGCSGVRDKAKFVPMNRYTHGTMMDDYVLLEDVGRRVNEWGREIARGDYGSSLPSRGGSRGGKFRPQGKAPEVACPGKSGIDIEVDLLPVGMQRQMLNHSTWDPKKRTAFLTVEYNIHPPYGQDASPNDTKRPYTLLTHRNNFETPLRDLFQSQISQRTTGKNRADLPTWVKTVALPHPDFGYIKLDGGCKLSTLLRNKQFVEFPTIEVWEEGSFHGVLLDPSGAFELQGEQRPAKRRRLDVSDEADTTLTWLCEYDGSDVEKGQPTTSEEGDTDSLTDDDDGDNEGDPGAIETSDLATLLAMVQEAQRRDGENGDYDEVDWGESDKDI